MSKSHNHLAGMGYPGSKKAVFAQTERWTRSLFSIVVVQIVGSIVFVLETSVSGAPMLAELASIQDEDHLLLHNAESKTAVLN